MRTSRLRLTATALTLAGALAAAVAAQPAQAATGNPFAGARLYVDPHSDAARAVTALRPSNPYAAGEIAKIARTSRADWYGDWNPTGTLAATVAHRVATIRAAGALPVLVAYAIPHRDCGGGGEPTAAAYRGWVYQLSRGLGSQRAAVVLEPDALAQLPCLSAADQLSRLSLLSWAVGVLRHNGVVSVYLDAGHSGWVPATTMANRLHRAGVAGARGFSLNVSNFDTTAVEKRYGNALVHLLGGGHFIVDTGRDGLGPASGPLAWCNPSGRALGPRPTTATGDASADAYLWVKPPGESDGTCRPGEPAAGQWWTAYALGLAERAAY